MNPYWSKYQNLNNNKQGLLCNLQFFSHKIIVPWGTIKLKENIGNSWITFRIAIDVKKRANSALDEWQKNWWWQSPSNEKNEARHILRRWIQQYCRTGEI